MLVTGESLPPPLPDSQDFEAFDLQIAYDKVGRQIEISVTVSEAVANAFENTKALRKEGFEALELDKPSSGRLACKMSGQLAGHVGLPGPWRTLEDDLSPLFQLALDSG